MICDRIVKKLMKLLFCIFFLCLSAFFQNISYGISNEFQFIIDTIGIPEYNKLGERINEQIYQVYHFFVYSDPVSITARTTKQRFKVVDKKGKWKQEGTNQLGEYYILGSNYQGDLVTNVYFPSDFIPEVPPQNWNFISDESALQSWNDSSKYRYIEQLEYMKNSNIQFDKIDFENQQIDSYELIEYPINAMDIGLDKAVLETCATWKTAGIIRVNRMAQDHSIRHATFYIKAMAASADVKAFLDIDDNFVLQDGKVRIKFKFGAQAINLTNYAKEEHIKEIFAQVLINNQEIATVKANQQKKVEKEVFYEMSQKDFESLGVDKLTIQVKCYLYTEFNVDGLMQDKIERDITIRENIEEEVPVTYVLLKQLEKLNSDYYLRDLLQTQQTRKVNSVGMIEKGRKIAILIKDFPKEVQDLSQIDVIINENKCAKELMKQNDNEMILNVSLDKDIDICSTIASWKSLRDFCGSYYEVEANQVGKRLAKPNELKVHLRESNQEYVLYFDTIDEFQYNMNYTYQDEFLNFKEYQIRRKL